MDGDLLKCMLKEDAALINQTQPDDSDFTLEAALSIATYAPDEDGMEDTNWRKAWPIMLVRRHCQTNAEGVKCAPPNMWPPPTKPGGVVFLPFVIVPDDLLKVLTANYPGEYNHCVPLTAAWKMMHMWAMKDENVRFVFVVVVKPTAQYDIRHVYIQSWLANSKVAPFIDSQGDMTAQILPKEWEPSYRSTGIYP